MKRKPLSGAIIGILIGVAVAVILARLGVWPADQLTLFLLPAVTGLLGMIFLSVGRENSIVTMVIALIILVPMAVWGALGFGEIDQNGELNGGCTVDAESSVDRTDVIDTSRSDPFEIDPDGGLVWEATSPEPFMDYEWELYVIAGGIPIPIDSSTESNSAGDVENGGDVSDVGAYASERGINIDLYVGVYEVGGSAATCDGFGFVEIVGDGIDVVTIVAIVLIVLLLVLLLILFYTGRGVASVESAEVLEAPDDFDVSDAVDQYEPGAEDLPDTDDMA